jgi:hypothetical protein
MKWCVLIGVLAGLMISTSASAETLRSCGKVAQTWKLEANPHTSCAFARATWTILAKKSKTLGHPYSGDTIVHSPVTHLTYHIDCEYNPHGRVVYLCGGLPDGALGGNIFIEVRSPTKR